MKTGSLDIMARQLCVARVMMLAGVLAGMAFPQTPPPDWVKTPPRTPDQYVGIGRVDKLAHPRNYRELAQSSALAQISLEISAQVKSEATSSQSEDEHGIRESFAQNIMLASANHLTGYQTTGDFETEEEYWVLITLEKSAHEKFLDDKAKLLADRLMREVAELRADLENRRFRNAMDRYSELRKIHAALGAAPPLSSGRRAFMDSLCDSAQALLREATRHPLEISMELHAEGSDVPDDAIRRLRGTLSHFQSPFYRVTQNHREGNTLKIRLQGMDRDTLEGLTFTALRGEVCWPGDPLPKTVRGKSGHTDRDRSLSLALRDFVKDLERLHP